ncbi:hypothetical protein DSUL_100160 [Desulfovibrionales bacterium]
MPYLKIGNKQVRRDIPAPDHKKISCICGLYMDGRKKKTPLRHHFKIFAKASLTLFTIPVNANCLTNQKNNRSISPTKSITGSRIHLSTNISALL